MASMLHCFRTLFLHMIVARETLVNIPKTRDMKFGGLQTPRIGFFIRGGPYSCLEILDRKTGSLHLEKSDKWLTQSKLVDILDGIVNIQPRRPEEPMKLNPRNKVKHH